MKKLFLVIVITLFTVACSSSYLKSINLKKLNSMLDNKESFILYLTNEIDEGMTLKNTLIQVAKENELKTYFINTEKLSDEELEKLKEKFTFEDTNIILFINEGVEKTVLSRIDDTFISKDKLEEEFKIQGYLK